MQDFTKIGDSQEGGSDLPQPMTFEDQQEPSSHVSRAAQVKSEITKHFLEQHFHDVLRESSECKQRHREFRNRLNQGDYSRKEKKTLESEFAQNETKLKRVKRRNFRVDQFDFIKLIGRGAFGEVFVCKDREDEQIYAMKILRKAELVAKNQILNTLAERDFLTQSNNPWSVQLVYSFSDTKNLYLVMEFLPGGDLMNLLIKRGVLTETETKFIIAETLLAIHHVHETNFIHRDIKPDNLLLTKDGHIRLTDFGLSTKTDRYSDPLVKLIDELTDVIQEKNTDALLSSQPIREKKRREQICSTVGTPDYIAPEVLLKQPYTYLVDFWSLGAIMYEMLFGSPPFLADTPRGTALRIVRWRETLRFPSVPPVSSDAVDLIRHLLCDAEDRLDYEGIRSHRFFSGIDWEHIQSLESPCKPSVKDELDTSNFDEFEPKGNEPDVPANDTDDIANLAFMGFKYNKRAVMTLPPGSVALPPPSSKDKKEKKDKKDKKDKKEKKDKKKD